jgi:hypothetical protein
MRRWFRWATGGTAPTAFGGLSQRRSATAIGQTQSRVAAADRSTLQAEVGSLYVYVYTYTPFDLRSEGILHGAVLMRGHMLCLPRNTKRILLSLRRKHDSREGARSPTPPFGRAEGRRRRRQPSLSFMSQESGEAQRPGQGSWSFI